MIRRIFFTFLLIAISQATFAQKEKKQMYPTGGVLDMSSLPVITPNGWDKTEGKIRRVRKTTQPLPDHVYNNTNKYFPPVFNQAGGSCQYASTIGYVYTYERAAYGNLNPNLPENQYCTHFGWLIRNQGVSVEETMTNLGVPNAVTYNGRLYSEDFGEQDEKNIDCGWMTGYEKWHSAMYNRDLALAIFPCTLNTPEGREMAKEWLVNHNGDSDFPVGGCFIVNIAAEGMDWKALTATATNQKLGVAGKNFITHYGKIIDHAVSIVGYDDRIECDVNGDGIIQDDEVGAWLMQNSWGPNGPSCNGDGTVWIPYKMAYGVQTDQTPWDGARHFLHKNYVPQRTVRMKVQYSHRGELYIHAGVSNDINATKPDYEIDFSHFKYMINDASKGVAPAVPMLGKWNGVMNYAPMEFGYDITRLSENIDKALPQKYFFYVDTKDGGCGNGNVFDCTLIDYEDNPDGTEYSSGVSDSAPRQILNNGRRILFTIVVPGNGCYAPSGLTLDSNSLTWQAPKASAATVKGYNIYRNDIKVHSVSARTIACTLPEPNGLYHVTAVYSNGIESSPSNYFSPEVNEQSVSATITGDVNATYFQYIRNMVTEHRLRDINMADANVAQSSKYYMTLYRILPDEFPAHIFENATTLRNIILPKSLKSIGEKAFKYSGIENVDFSDGITSIRFEAFAHCNNIKKAVLPACLQNLAMDNFAYCSSFEELIIKGQLQNLGQGVCYGNAKRTKVWIYNNRVISASIYIFDNGADVHVYPELANAYRSAAHWNHNTINIIGDLERPLYVSNLRTEDDNLVWDGNILDNDGEFIIYRNGVLAGKVPATERSYSLNGSHGLYQIKAVCSSSSEEFLSDYVSTDVNEQSVSATIVGEVNNTYLGYIRKMVEKHSLKHIDMSDATIVSGGDTYFHGFDIVDNEMPKATFDHCLNLVSLRLPYTLKKTGFDCFAYCDNLETIYFGPNIEYIEQGCCYNPHRKNINVYLPITNIPSGAGYMFWIGANIHILPGMTNKFLQAEWWNETEHYNYIEDYGDINGDSRVTIADITLLTEILNGRASDNGRANIDCKNGVTTDDVKALRKIINEEK